jgi:dipeptidase E
MQRLLLASTSRTYGTQYLDHVETAVRRHFAGLERVLFVPYALHDRRAYSDLVRRRFEALGLGVDGLEDASDPVAAVERAQGIFVGGGNTFRLLKSVREAGLIDPIRVRVAGGMPYLGSSAGTNLAGPTIRTTNDMPIVEPGTFEALGLVPFQINPHYLDPDPDSRHMGESRETRIREYLEENEIPVVALREGACLSVEGQRVTLLGEAGARIFRRGRDPEEVAPVAEIRP